MSITSPTLVSAASGALDALIVEDMAGPDRLRLVPVPLVPRMRLYLADDPIILRARLEAAGGAAPAPYWASAWAGGQALARYLLDHPAEVAGRRVLDLASGSGIAAIAAAMSGAATVTANDIDPYALAAIALNARANRVRVELNDADLLGTADAGPDWDADTVLAGDIFYNAPLAGRTLPFLQRLVANGARVLVGDPGRAHLPAAAMRILAQYDVSMVDNAEDAQYTRAYVLEPVRSWRRVAVSATSVTAG